jgi:uncharacterized coiled-coil DUF342 family protein
VNPKVTLGGRLSTATEAGMTDKLTEISDLIKGFEVAMNDIHKRTDILVKEVEQFNRKERDQLSAESVKTRVDEYENRFSALTAEIAELAKRFVSANRTGPSPTAGH